MVLQSERPRRTTTGMPFGDRSGWPARHAHVHHPQYKSRMPPVALWREEAPIVEDTGNVSRRGDALLAQSLNGCHGGFVTHQPYRLVWPVVVHGPLPAGLRRRCIPNNAPVAILIPVHNFIPARHLFVWEHQEDVETNLSSNPSERRPRRRCRDDGVKLSAHYRQLLQRRGRCLAMGVRAAPG